MTTPVDQKRLADARLKLAAARVKVSEVQPYLSAVIWRMVFHVKPEWNETGFTIATDERGNIFVSLDRVEKDNLPGLAASLVHEAYHLLRSHFGRRGDRDPMLFNLAGDCSLIPDVDDCWPEYKNRKELMRPELIGAKRGLTAEEYYDILEKNAVRITVQSNCGSCAGNQHGDEDKNPAGGNNGKPDDADAGKSGADGLQPEPANVSPAEWETIQLSVAHDVKEHVRQHKPGVVPGGLQRWADDQLAPSPIDWRRVLGSVIRGTMRRAGMHDFTYATPSRRRLPGIILPSMRSPVIEAAVVVDTSGSMTEQMLQDAVSDIQALLKACGAQEIRLVVCDAAVHADKIIKNGRQAGKLLTGGGGTDLRIGMARACEPSKGMKPTIVVVLTDGYTPWPDSAPKGIRVAVVVPPGGPETPEWATRVERIEGAK